MAEFFERLEPKHLEFIAQQKLFFVATAAEGAHPNLSPKGTTSVYDDEHLFFAEIRSPRTIENLRANPAIEVNVVDPIVRKGYRFKGTATLHEGDDVYRRALELLRERDYGDYEERIQLIVLIRVERAEPLTSPAYDVGHTEDELAAQYRHSV